MLNENKLYLFLKSFLVKTALHVKVFRLVFAEVTRSPLAEHGALQCNGKQKFPPAWALGTSPHATPPALTHCKLPPPFRCWIDAVPCKTGI